MSMENFNNRPSRETHAEHMVVIRESESFDKLRENLRNSLPFPERYRNREISVQDVSPEGAKALYRAATHLDNPEPMRHYIDEVFPEALEARREETLSAMREIDGFIQDYPGLFNIQKNRGTNVASKDLTPGVDIVRHMFPESDYGPQRGTFARVYHINNGGAKVYVDNNGDTRVTKALNSNLSLPAIPANTFSDEGLDAFNDRQKWEEQQKTPEHPDDIVNKALANLEEYRTNHPLTFAQKVWRRFLSPV